MRLHAGIAVAGTAAVPAVRCLLQSHPMRKPAHAYRKCKAQLSTHDSCLRPTAHEERGGLTSYVTVGIFAFSLTRKGTSDVRKVASLMSAATCMPGSGIGVNTVWGMPGQSHNAVLLCCHMQMQR